MLADDFKSYGREIKKLLRASGVDLASRCSFREVIDVSYQHLLDYYRHEYLYKTALLNSYVLQNFSLSDTLLLNEFRIGKSKADAVLVNGTNKVFEIKTELDRPERLSTQLNDYYRAFSEVFIVVHHSLVDKYRLLVDEKVGVMIFDNNVIEVERQAIVDHSSLDIESMIKALRKDEYLALVKALSGRIPAVSPVLLFKTCVGILKQFGADEVHFEFLNVIKKRINSATSDMITRSELPESMRLSCYYSNLGQNEYVSLLRKLDSRL